MSRKVYKKTSADHHICASTEVFRDRAGIRTQDPQLRRLLLYPAELPDHPYFRGAKVILFL